MKLINLPEETTEVQAAVIELRQGQRKNALKFGALMILLFMFVGGMLSFVATIGDNKDAIEGIIGVLNGLQKSGN